MRHLFLDANCLFTAAHNPAGKASPIIRLGGEGHWTLSTSDYAIEEARRNIARNYLGCLAALTELQSVSTAASRAFAGRAPAANLRQDGRQPRNLAAARRRAGWLRNGANHLGQ